MKGRNSRERDTVACVFASPLREETVSANNLIEEKMFSQDFAIDRQLCYVENKRMAQSSGLWPMRHSCTMLVKFVTCM